MAHQRRAVLTLLLAALAGATPASVRQRCYGDAAKTLHPCERHVYTVHMPSSGVFLAQLACDASRATAQARINGASLKWISPGQFTLPLRRGINTIALSIQAAGACDLAVVGALPRPTVGAQLSYIELEAENATATTGSMIGPNYTYHSLPSEASQRMAVQLAPGQYIDFTVPPGAAANAIMVRFSIPDAAAGGGIDTPLLVYMNGTQMAANVTLTSAYSWQYGSCPFTKNPSDGGPHHFYDEFALWLPARLPASSTIRLMNPAPMSRVTRRGLQSGASCSVPIPDPSKRDCGFNGINETQCLDRNCCWVPINPNPNSYPWCYFPPTPPPPPPEPGNITITIDLMDIFDVPAADPAPPNAVSIIDHGADPTGGSDSSAAIAAAIAAAGSSQPVWAPPGNYTVTAHITLPDNLTLVGAGPWYTKFAGKGVGLYGNGPSMNVHVSGLSIIGDTRVRIDSMADQGIGGGLTDSVVSDLRIEHTKCGCWVDGPFDSLLITGLVIRNTFADGVNFHKGVTNSVVEHSAVRNTGDDGLAMWSDADADTNNTFQFNTIQTPVLANNIAIYGGSGNAMRNNLVIDTLTAGGGLHVGNRFSSVPLAGQTVVDGNTAVRCGQFDPGFQFGVGALWFYALDEAMTGAVAVTNNVLRDSQYEAVQFIGSSVTNIAFSNLSVVNVGSFVFQFQCGGAATVQDVVASGSQYAGIYNCGETFALTDLGGNAGWNTTKCGFPPE